MGVWSDCSNGVTHRTWNGLSRVGLVTIGSVLTVFEVLNVTVNARPVNCKAGPCLEREMPGEGD